MKYNKDNQVSWIQMLNPFSPNASSGGAAKSAAPGTGRGKVPNRQLKFDDDVQKGTQQEGQLEAIVRKVQVSPIQKLGVIKQLWAGSSEKEGSAEHGKEYPQVLSNPLPTFPLGTKHAVIPVKKIFGPQIEQPKLPLKQIAEEIRQASKKWIEEGDIVNQVYDEGLPSLQVQTYDVSDLSTKAAKQVWCKVAKEEKITVPFESMPVEEIEEDEKTVKSRIWLEVEVEGLKMDALIETGSSFSFMNLRTARQYFSHVRWEAVIMQAKTTSGDTIKVVAQCDLSLKIGSTVATHKMYVVQNSPRKLLIGDDFMAKHNFVIGYPERWV